LQKLAGAQGAGERPGDDPLPRRGLQQLHLGAATGRPEVVDLAGTAAGGIHDLRRGGTRGRLHCPHISDTHPHYGREPGG